MHRKLLQKIFTPLSSIFIIATLIVCDHQLKAYKYKLSMCAIFQQEAPYLKEWIEFHKLMGVQHFYLYNNFSTDNFQEILAPYIKTNEVELINWDVHAKPNDGTWVLSAYNHALNSARGKTQWLAFLDLDEFLFTVQKDTLINFLKDYEQFGGICANWVMFGTGNIQRIPPGGLQTEYLLLRAPDNHPENLHVKSIIQPDKTLSIPSPHGAHYKQGYFQVTADKIPFQGPFSPFVALDKIRINHYWSRDEYFFYNVKIPRRLMDMGESKEECIKRNNNINKIEDKVIHKHLRALKERLSKNQVK